jgi:acetylornithine deacetylase
VDATEAAVLDAVDDDEVLADLRALVSIPSVGGTDAECEVQEWCANRLRDLGAEVDHWRLDLAALRADAAHPGEEVPRDEAWGCVGRLPGAQDGASPALVLAGHVDVVPPGDLDGWPDRDPWTVRERAGNLYARGACDMKAGVAAVLGAAAALRRAGVRLRRPLAVHTVVGEEDGGLGAFAALRRGHTGEACVIAEPTDHALVVANAGALTFRLEVPGLATHGSTRTRGVSALDAVAPVLEALRVLEAERNAVPPPGFGHLDLAAPISVGLVRAGDWASTVPDLLVAEGRFGVLPGEGVDEARTRFEQAVAEVCGGHPWLAGHPVRVSWPGGQFASGALPAGHPLAGEVADAVTAVGAAAPARVGAPYGSDLRLYCAAGVPTLQYGPGDVRFAHASDEHVAAGDVVHAARAFALLALRRCGAA